MLYDAHHSHLTPAIDLDTGTVATTGATHKWSYHVIQ